jgi:hypothetical protein
LYIAKEFKQPDHEKRIDHLFDVINPPLLLISKKEAMKVNLITKMQNRK